MFLGTSLSTNPVQRRLRCFVASRDRRLGQRHSWRLQQLYIHVWDHCGSSEQTHQMGRSRSTNTHYFGPIVVWDLRNIYTDPSKSAACYTEVKVTTSDRRVYIEARGGVRL